MTPLNKFFFDRLFLRFLFIGGVNALFGYSIFALFVFFGFIYPLAVLFATILGVLFNFKTISKFVFNQSENSRIFHFVSVYIFIYCLNVFGLWWMEILGLGNKYIAGAVLLVPLAIISFALNKKYVFSKVSV